MNVPPLPVRRFVKVRFINSYNDLIFKPNSYRIHFCPKLWTSSKSVFAKIWNTPLHLNYASNVFPQSLWSVLFFFLQYLSDLVIRSLLLASHAQLVDKNFVHTEPTTCKLLSRKVMRLPFCLAVALYIPCTSFCLERSYMFHSALRWPCIYFAPLMGTSSAHYVQAQTRFSFNCS